MRTVSATPLVAVASLEAVSEPGRFRAHDRIGPRIERVASPQRLGSDRASLQAIRLILKDVLDKELQEHRDRSAPANVSLASILLEPLQNRVCVRRQILLHEPAPKICTTVLRSGRFYYARAAVRVRFSASTTCHRNE